MGWAGIYALDLYCDKQNDAHKYREFPHQVTHEKGSVCRAKARKAGWIIRNDGTAICPKCSGKKSQKVIGDQTQRIMTELTQ